MMLGTGLWNVFADRKCAEILLPMADENYTWTQEFAEVEMTFVLPEKVEKGAVRFHSTKSMLRVVYGDSVLADGELFAPVNPEETYWYIVDNQLKFVLSKSKGAWWECIIRGHKTVDVSKVAESKTVSDLGALDPEERRIVQEMMVGQKARGGAGDAEENARKDEILKKISEMKG